MNPFPADDARLEALILHISLRCGEMRMPRFDIALLERMLFQADFLHFRLCGVPITGQTYHRGLRSPAPQSLRRMVRRMIQSGEFTIREVEVGDGLHVRCIPAAQREPDLRIFDGQEIAVVERVLWFYRQNWNAETASPDLLEIPWELADLWEEIPYALALISGVPSDAAPQTPRLLIAEKLAEKLQEIRPRYAEDADTSGLLPDAVPIRIPAHANPVAEINRMTMAD